MIWEYNTYNLTVVNATNATIAVLSNGTGSPMQSKYYGPVPTSLPAGVTYITLYNQLEATPNITKTCNTLIASLNTYGAQMLRRMQVWSVECGVDVRRPDAPPHAGVC